MPGNGCPWRRKVKTQSLEPILSLTGIELQSLFMQLPFPTLIFCKFRDNFKGKYIFMLSERSGTKATL